MLSLIFPQEIPHFLIVDFQVGNSHQKSQVIKTIKYDFIF